MQPRQQYALKRDLGIWAASAIVVGTVIGSAIFLVPHSMIRDVGSTSTLFWVWIVGGLLTLFGALSYAELAAAMPEAGGEYVYLREAYGPFWGFVYGWTQMWVAKSGSLATLAAGFVRYLGFFLPQLKGVWAVVPLPLGEKGKPLEFTYGQLVAIGVILFLAIVNYFGVKVGGEVQVGLTLLKLAMVATIIVVGLMPFHPAATATDSGKFDITGGFAGFFAALVAVLWAYDGWNNVVMVSSEIRNPKRNLPLALIAGVSAIIGIYLLANVAYFHVLTPGAVAKNELVAGEMMRVVLGDWGARITSITVMISIFAAINGSILSGARVPYATARDGLFFRRVANIHPKFRTPGVSILALSAWGSLLVLSGSYEQLFNYVIFASVILYGMATASVIVLRFKRPDLERPYRTLGYPIVPILFVVGIACLTVSTLITKPLESLKGLGIVAAGIPFYFYWSRKRSARPAG